MPTNRSIGAVSRQALHQRKADAVLAAEAIALPAADASWLDETAAALDAFRVGLAARLLEPEDIPQVVRHFANLDDLYRAQSAYRADRAASAPPRTLDEHLRGIKALSSIVLTGERELGIGPTQRRNLGILDLQGMKAQAEAEDELERALRG